MKKKIFAITVSIISLLSPAGWASELKKDELDKVVAFAKNLGVYDCYNFEDAYRHTRMNQVHTVGEHSIYRVACVQAAYLAVSPPLTEVIRLEITDPFDKATLYYVRTTDYAPYRP